MREGHTFELAELHQQRRSFGAQLLQLTFFLFCLPAKIMNLGATEIDSRSLFINDKQLKRTLDGLSLDFELSQFSNAADITCQIGAAELPLCRFDLDIYARLARHEFRCARLDFFQASLRLLKRQ
jgi:hypothetical protein